MIRGIIIILFLSLSFQSFAQTGARIRVMVRGTEEPVPGASVKIKGRLAVTDTSGFAHFTGLAAGEVEIEITHVGFNELKMKAMIQEGSANFFEYYLEPSEEEEEEVVIQSTRSNRSIRDIPTRVEFVAGEELDEKSNMKPGDIRMVLNESTGIQTQQTSVTSANASIRIQGLDGRYTQVLKDGFPLYAGMSSGLGLLQTPPLDLKQFEVIKGSASTLYGGGAIAGLVNLISKTPSAERELKFHLDATSAGGLNTSGFYGQRFKKTGLTFFASRNSNAPYDPAGIGLTAIPKFERYTANPKLFFELHPRVEIIAGVNFTTEERTGGDIEFIKENKPSGFYEKNETDRISTELTVAYRIGEDETLMLKNSYNHFRRVIFEPTYTFGGDQDGTFTELTYSNHNDRSEWIGGLNVLTDGFRETRYTSIPYRDYDQLTLGAFVQNSSRLTDQFHLETGLRGDYVNDYGFILLPRVSALFRLNPKWTSRIGGGLGYKTPNVFTEESEKLQYRNVLPIDDEINKLERSYGVNADINFRTKLADGEIDLGINHLFFYTRIHDPLILEPEFGYYRFRNIDGFFDSKGMETNVRLGYGDFKLYLGYTYTRAFLHEGSNKTLNFLTPTHRLNSVLLYEVEEKWKAGLEAYYFGSQQLSDGTTGESYWITGFMVEKLWEKLSLYINFENFLDTRQTRMGSIYTGTLENPVFKDIYAPLDGFVINGGIKLRL